MSFVGIDAKGAVEMLDLADTDPKKQLALSRIESDRRAGFDWSYFWRALNEPSRLSNLDRASQTRLFKLSGESCAPESFALFAEVVLQATHGFELVFGPARSCSQPIPKELFAKYLEYFRAQKASERTFAELMITEYIQLKDTDRATILRLLNTNEWSKIVHGLLRKGEANLAAQLVQMHQNQFGGIKFVDDLIVDWLENPAELHALVSKNNLIDIAHIMVTDPQLRWMNGKINSDRWLAVFRVLSEKFAIETARLADNPDILDQLLNTISLLGTLPLRAENAPKFSKQLLWAEDLLRALEAGVRSSESAARALRFATQDPAALWVKYRIAGGFEGSDRDALQGMTGSSPIAEALLLKLRLHSSQTDYAFSRWSSVYCGFLEANGLPERQLEGSQLSLDTLREPGCVRLIGNTHPEDTVALEVSGDVLMAFDHLLTTNGWNLNIKANRLDGSLIDLSTALKHADLPLEPTPVRDNAVTVPLLMGIRVRDQDFDQGVGIYYFVYHYTWRAPMPGRPSNVRAADGFAGANINIEVADLPRTYLPRYVSKGGPGQKGAPRRLGGLGDVSEVNWDRFTSEISQRRPIDSSDKKFSQPIAFPSPTIRLLDQLLKVGDLTASGATELLVDPEMLWSALDQNQKRKSRLICPAGPSDRDCWTQVVNRAAADLWRDYVAVCPSDRRGEQVCPASALDHALPRLSSIRFEEFQAEVGPVNPDGNFGPNGKLTIQERR